MSLMVADPPPSSSGARLTGDDLQHLVAWYWALTMARPDSDIEGIEIEALSAGNVDDVVVRRRHGPSQFYQVKAAVRGEAGVTAEWLMALSRSGGPSILQKFYRTWRALGNGGLAELALVTNRSLDRNDPVLGGRDRNGYLSAALARAFPGSPAAYARTEWARHLETDEEGLYKFLDNLRLETDALESTWRSRVADISLGLGLRAGEVAIRAGVHEVREWVKNSRIMRTVNDVRDAIDRLKLRVEEPYAVLAIHALGRDPVAADETVALDWVDRFEGEEARERRQLRNPADWNAVLRQQLRRAAEQIRAGGHRRVLVRGAMRLPSWFAAGVYLGETAGFTVAALQGSELWSSHRRNDGTATGPAAPMKVKRLHDNVVGTGSDLAVAMALSLDPTAEVIPYLEAVPGVRRYVALTTPSGPGRLAIANADEATATAVALRDEIRALALEGLVRRVHLFLATPHGLALLLGHLWDRLPPTQLYEDLGSGRGYTPSFLIPN